MFKKLLILAPLLVACSKGGDDRLKEKADIESGAAARNQIEAQNTRAREMEADLALRHNFYQTVRGRYEGSFSTELGEFKIRILLVPTLSRVEVNRVRLPEEVASDLNNLHFNAQIQQWSADNPSSAAGCRVEGIRPDLKNGVISIVSASCPNVYFLALSNEGDNRSLSASDHYRQTLDGGSSGRISASIVAGRTRTLDELAGYIQLTNLANSYHFRAKRIEP